MSSIRESIGPDAVKQLHANLDELLNGTTGWLIMADTAKHKVSDVYSQVCDRCVVFMTAQIVSTAVGNGFLIEEGLAKLHGHKHDFEEPPQPKRQNPGLQK